MKKLISLALLFTLTLSAMAFSSCRFGTPNHMDYLNSTYDGSEVTIEIWHTFATSSGVSPIERASYEFKKLYPNITIKTRVFGHYEQIYEFVTECTDETMPNLVFCSPSTLMAYHENDMLVSLDHFINNKNIIASTNEMTGFTQAQIDDFVDTFYNEGKIFGSDTLYSLPFVKSTDLLYYNKSVFDELGLKVPTTWDEMEQCFEVLKEAYPDCTPLGYQSTENLFITLAAQYGSDYTSANGEYLFVNDKNKAFVSKFAEWYQKGYLTLSEFEYGPYDDFANAQTLMYVGNSVGIMYFYPTKIDGEFTFELGAAPIPQFDPSNPKTVAEGEASICLIENQNSQEVYASWLFLKYLMTDMEFQARSATQYNSMPVLNSVKDSDEYKTYVNNSFTNGSLRYIAMELVPLQADSCFTTPIFEGYEKARENVGLLVRSIFEKYQLGADNSAMIDEEFQKALDECKK